MTKHEYTSSNLPLSYEILVDETSSIWLNTNNAFTLLPPTEFIFASERTGFRHLYHVVSGDVRQITSGNEWVLSDDAELTIDKDRKLVYFTGIGHLESHLYVASYGAELKCERITKEGLSHRVYMQDGCGMFADVNSSLDQPPLCDISEICKCRGLIEVDFEEGDWMPKTRLVIKDVASRLDPPSFSTAIMESSPEKVLSVVAPLSPPTLFEFKNSVGTLLHGMMFTPDDFDPSKRYPTILQIYAGPHCQVFPLFQH
jgi:hypothetical protein